MSPLYEFIRKFAYQQPIVVPIVPVIHRIDDQNWTIANCTKRAGCKLQLVIYGLFIWMSSLNEIAKQSRSQFHT